MKKILLIEDETHVISFIRKGLTEEGFEISVAMDGKAGLQMFSAHHFDLIILDIMLPGMNGIAVCNEIRKTNPKIPVLFLTALGTSENIVLGLNTGADDYLVKPFKFIELVARIRTLLRRTDISGQIISNQEDDSVLRFEDLELNDRTKSVMREKQKISLTTTEYKLLLYFIKNPNKVLSRLEIMENVWGVDFDLGTNVVDVYVNYLRKKMENEKSPRLIHTHIGMGYILKKNND